MKVLFLDVDGVLNSTETFARRRKAWETAKEADVNAVLDEYAWPLGHLDKELVCNLNPIVEQTKCSIVLSSSWRLVCQLENFRQWVSQKGFKYPDTIIDRTPNLAMRSEDLRRGTEIMAWMEIHQGITRYAILDDDGFDIQPMHPKTYVNTDGNEGLTLEKVEAVVKILNA